MTNDELETVLDLHGKWLRSEEGGKRANLQGADLQGADLQGANLQRAKNSEIAAVLTAITPEGDIIGWKKCREGVVVKLLIPKKAKRSNAAGRKCRAEYVKVLDVEGGGVAISQHDGKTEYRKGKTVRCDSWCDDRWQECSGGINFYVTREEAVAH